jgi:hypothetical protein
VIVDCAIHHAAHVLSEMEGASPVGVSRYEPEAALVIGAFMQYIDERKLQDLSIPDECIDGLEWLAYQVSVHT